MTAAALRWPRPARDCPTADRLIGARPRGRVRRHRRRRCRARVDPRRRAHPVALANKPALYNVKSVDANVREDESST